MDLDFDKNLCSNYHSHSQIARVLTENWVNANMYCPRCGNPHINHFENNRPVADFFCPVCKNEYELKSKNGVLGHKVCDGAYETM
ncbi:MAG: DpnI domain-containing protein, partial [Acutalibacteraceae bacterium]